MFAKHIYRMLLVAVWLLGYAQMATAQLRMYDPKPLSNVGGPTGEALSSIYQSSIGRGYSASSLNTLSLQYAKERTPFVGQSTTRSYANSSGPGLGLGASNADKPFSSFSPEPTTSPYLNLFREDFEGNSDVNYNTLVRPQLQQQQFNQQVQRQTIDQSRRIDNLAAKADFNLQGDKNEYPTGHPTAFRYLGHYYQMPNARKRGR